jgi:predicted NodU family carbamoyl transferase
MVGKMGGFGLFGVVFKGRLNNDRESISALDRQNNSYLGTEYCQKDIQSFIDHLKLPHEHFSDSELFDRIATMTSEEKVFG